MLESQISDTCMQELYSHFPLYKVQPEKFRQLILAVPQPCVARRVFQSSLRSAKRGRLQKYHRALSRGGLSDLNLPTGRCGFQPSISGANADLPVCRPASIQPSAFLNVFADPISRSNVKTTVRTQNPEGLNIF